MLLDHDLSFDSVEDHTMYNIITDAIVPANKVQQIINTEGIGQVGYEQFVEDRLKVNSKIPIWYPMKIFIIYWYLLAMDTRLYYIFVLVFGGYGYKVILYFCIGIWWLWIQGYIIFLYWYLLAMATRLYYIFVLVFGGYGYKVILYFFIGICWLWIQGYIIFLYWYLVAMDTRLYYIFLLVFVGYGYKVILYFFYW